MMPQYLLITPTRDEMKFASKTLECVIGQSVLPGKWVIVDDGSTDGTGALLDRYAEAHDFIEVIHRPDRGRRSVGPGVVHAFYAGLAKTDLDEYEFVCKLDLDVELPRGYFERLIDLMRESPRLGSVSGKPYFRNGAGKLVAEVASDQMSVGMTKFYRTACFREIGGFVRQVMWDGIDCHRCRMLGWQARSVDEPGLRFVHLRPMGSSQRSILAGRFRHGFGQYFMGSCFSYVTASAVCRMAHPPALVGSVAMWLGYVHSAMTRKRRYEDLRFRRFLQGYQRACLCRGKRRATAMLDERQAARWQAREGPQKRMAAMMRNKRDRSVTGENGGGGALAAAGEKG